MPNDRGFVIEAAADDTVVSLYPRFCVDFLAEVDEVTRRALRDLELDAISRTRVHLFFGRRMTPAAKVSSFLLDMENRVSCDDSGWLEPPIALPEIAGYLVLSEGTVSWLLTLLAGQRIIARAGDRRLRILDRAALEDKEIVLAADGPRWPVAPHAGGRGAAQVREDRRDETGETSEAISR